MHKHAAVSEIDGSFQWSFRIWREFFPCGIGSQGNGVHGIGDPEQCRRKAQFCDRRSQTFGQSGKSDMEPEYREKPQVDILYGDHAFMQQFQRIFLFEFAGDQRLGECQLARREPDLDLRRISPAIFGTA